MTEKNRAMEQAETVLGHVKAMVQRLDHVHECRGDDDCDLGDAEILAGINKAGATATDEDRKEYHDEYAVREAILEGALAVEVRSGWHTPGEAVTPTEYKITICTGGPAVQIVGDLDRYGYPDTAEIQYQDWFTPWESLDLAGEEEEAVLAYARQFYFGD